MSSLLLDDKDQTRSRKSLFDSSPTTVPLASCRGLRQERLSRLESGRPDVPRPRGTQPDQHVSQHRPSARRRTEEDLGSTDFKKLYEGALAANGRLRSRLDTTREELALIQSQLGRVTGQQLRRRAADQTANMLDTEKKENKTLEKKISHMEEELKAKAELTTENQRLKDENGALIRVISKLSK